MKKVLIVILLSFVLCTISTGKNGTNGSNRISNSVIKADSEGFSVTAFSERFLTTGVVIGEALILLVILYYWKRTREDAKPDSKLLLKHNIKAMRNEKVFFREADKETRKRKKILSDFNFNNINGKLITSKARKLSVSKGEVFLAARIYQLVNRVK